MSGLLAPGSADRASEPDKAAGNGVPAGGGTLPRCRAEVQTAAKPSTHCWALLLQCLCTVYMSCGDTAEVLR